MPEEGSQVDFAARVESRNGAEDDTASRYGGAPFLPRDRDRRPLSGSPSPSVQLYSSTPATSLELARASRRTSIVDSTSCAPINRQEYRSDFCKSCRRALHRSGSQRSATRRRYVAAEPLQGEAVQGLRSLEDGFVPPVLDQSLIDARILVMSGDAIRRTRQLKDQEGIFAGPSCGAALHAALRAAESLERGKIVVILADAGWKYLSEDLWTRDLDELEEDLEAKILW